MSDHDPFNEPTLAHLRARELMTESFFFDCADEAAPFGSDEGFDAYYEWRDWRAENPDASLVACFEWILDGQLSGYNINLASDEQIKKDIANPDSAFLSDHYDMFTLDVTIMATGLGQLMDEGNIDADAKPYLAVAIQRQRHPEVGFFELSTLDAIARVVDAA